MSTSFKQQAAEALCKNLTDYLDERYQEDIARNQWKKLSESEGFKFFHKSAKVKKFNQFVAETMLDIGIRVYDENRDALHVKLKQEVGFIFENLFDEDEAKQIYEFCKSEVGRKLLRNLDMFREAYTEATLDLMLKTYKAYNSPEVSIMLLDYMTQLEESNDDADVEE